MEDSGVGVCEKGLIPKKEEVLPYTQYHIVLVVWLKGIGEIGNLDLGTAELFLEWSHGEARAPEKCREAGAMAKDLRSLLLTTWASVWNWERQALFMEIRSYSSNLDTSPVIYITAILIIETEENVGSCKTL